MAPRHRPADYGKPDKPWMSHFHPDHNGRIVREALYNGYRAYTPKLVCVLTKWHNLLGGRCPHGTKHKPWYGCATGWSIGDESPAARAALSSDHRRIRLMPGRGDSQGSDGLPPTWWWPYPEGAHKTRKLREEIVARPAGLKELRVSDEKKRMDGPKMRFGRKPGANTGRDDPVGDGRDIAAGEDELPSDRWQQPRQRTAGGVLLVSREEKDVEELRRRGLLMGVDGGDDQLTLNSIVHEEPSYSIRIVPGRKTRGGRKDGQMVSTVDPGEEEGVETEISQSILELVAPDGSSSPEAGEVEADVPDCGCWGDFLSDMEAEGWVPVVDDDVVSVAESWAVVGDAEDEMITTRPPLH